MPEILRNPNTTGSRMSNTLVEDDYARKSMLDSMNTLKSSGASRNNQSNAINLKNRQLFSNHLNPDRLNARQMTADIEQSRGEHNNSITSLTKSSGNVKIHNNTPAASIRNLKIQNMQSLSSQQTSHV